jgi:hypothetical protein
MISFLDLFSKYIQKINKDNFLYISIFAMIYTINMTSCNTVTKCPDKVADGNISSPVNSSADELSPYIFDNEFYYTNRAPKSNDFQIMIANLDKLKPKNSIPFKNNSISSIEQAGLINLYRNNQLNRTFAFFAGISGKSKDANSDIFTTFKNKNDQWIVPKNISSVNSDTYDSYPAISSDGNILIFASTREGGVGGIDLYKSIKEANGEWSKPENLGSAINTAKDEISPFINFDNSLLFSSNGYSESGDFDIYSASDDGSGKWTDKHKLPIPINTNFNEICPSIYGNEIFFSSDRPGGCGAYDIYSFKHCGDVILDGTIESEESDLSLSGRLYLLNSNRELMEIIKIDDSGKFSINLKASNIYYIQYFSTCVPKYVPEKMIVAPCSDTNIVKIMVKFILPSTTTKFDFANYKVPFFVSGYYQPNTPTSLSSLRLKFAYNLLGNDNTTKYIEKPGNEYDDYALIVEGALNDAVEHIVRILENSNDECNRTKKEFMIKVTGFADPRTLSDYSKYIEESITDPQFDINIKKGDKLDNMTLSILRSYFTSRYLQSAIKGKIKSSAYNSIKWKIEGLGIDDTDKPNEQKRRVNIEIGLNNSN